MSIHRAILLSCWVLVLQLGGCGFHLRGTATLPFESISIPSQAPLALELGRSISSGSNAKVLTTGTAGAIFDLLGEQREKSILSLSPDGQPREYQLRYRVSYDVRDPKGGVYVPATTLTLRRNITFNNLLLAKEYEEQFLYQDMQSDMVQQILWRMQASKLHPPDED